MDTRAISLVLAAVLVCGACTGGDGAVELSPIAPEAKELIVDGPWQYGKLTVFETNAGHWFVFRTTAGASYAVAADLSGNAYAARGEVSAWCAARSTCLLAGIGTEGVANPAILTAGQDVVYLRLVATAGLYAIRVTVAGATGSGSR